MKHIVFSYSIAVILMACNSSTENTKNDTAYKDTIAPVQPQQVQDTSAAFPLKEMLTAYLQLKNALTKDNGAEAASAATKISDVLAKVNGGSLPASQAKAYADLHDDIKKHADHIGASASKIAQQREHFIMLSKNFEDLVKALGNGGQTLYKDFCPMANNGKGAIWLSELKEIKNPYYGKQMSTCGSVKEVIK